METDVQQEPLFYWYMLKSGYWLTEYLSISRVIAKSKKSYENAYLYTEADEKRHGILYSLQPKSARACF